MYSENKSLFWNEHYRTFFFNVISQEYSGKIKKISKTSEAINSRVKELIFSIFFSYSIFLTTLNFENRYETFLYLN